MTERGTVFGWNENVQKEAYFIQREKRIFAAWYDKMRRFDWPHTDKHLYTFPNELAEMVDQAIEDAEHELNYVERKQK